MRNKNTKPSMKAVKRMLLSLLQRWALSNCSYSSLYSQY